MVTKAQFIVKYLEPLYPNGDYVLNMYHAWCREKPLKPGTYAGFREALRRLKDTGKIEFYKHVPQNRPDIDDAMEWGKRYYRVRRGNI